MRSRHRNRRGAIALFLCLAMVPVVGLFAFSVDYGFLLFIRTDLQKAADNAALAAVRDLLPDQDGNQDLDKVRQTVKDYVQSNLGSGFTVLDSDIEIGRYNTSKIYESVQLYNSGIRDTVRVTIRRSELANKSVFLYFARFFDSESSSVVASATAVLQKARFIPDGTQILPITISTQAWNKIAVGDTFSIYGDGQLTDSTGKSIAGNWGTLDIGAKSNSTRDLVDQINDGLSQDDLDELAREGVITNSEYIDSQETIYPNGDTGFSSGIKQGVDSNIGKTKLAPIYQSVKGKGGSLEFKIVGWGIVRIESAKWNGGQKSRLTVTRSYTYDGKLRPNRDLSDTTNVIEGAFTSPALVE